MTDVSIRPTDPERDAEPIAALITETNDFVLHDADSVRHMYSDTNPRKRALSLVAERDGDVVGIGRTSFDLESSVEGAAVGSLMVAAGHRRRGIGSALYERLAVHWAEIGATTLTGRLFEDDAASFASNRGFKHSRVERISHVALADIPAAVPAPGGLRFTALSELDDTRPLFDVDNAVFADIPADEPWAALSYDEWHAQFMTDPRLDRDSTVLAFDGKAPVAVAWLDRVDDRVWSSLTGTRREYRGRGLAKAVKTAALHRARERGAVDAYTNNDATNAGMLAVNTWLGYRLHVEQFTFVKTLKSNSGGHS